MFSPGPRRPAFPRSVATGPPDINFTVSPGSPGRTPLPGAGLNITPETVSTGRSSSARSSPIAKNNNKLYYTNTATYDNYIVAIDDLHEYTNIQIAEITEDEPGNSLLTDGYFYPFVTKNNAPAGLTFGRLIVIDRAIKNSLKKGGKGRQTRHHKKGRQTRRRV
jgi:hypothetical protein